MSQLGTDFDCAEDITEDWALAASPQLVYLQAMYRRLVLTKLFYAPGYGLGIEGYLLDIATRAQITGEIQTELLKDERTRDVRVIWNDDGASISVRDHGGAEYSLSATVDAIPGRLALVAPEIL
jgi:hypothetical protein